MARVNPPTPELIAFGERFRGLLEARYKNLNQASRQLNIEYTVLYAWCVGRRYPSTRYAVKLNDVFPGLFQTELGTPIADDPLKKIAIKEGRDRFHRFVVVYAKDRYYPKLESVTLPDGHEAIERHYQNKQRHWVVESIIPQEAS